MGKPNESLCLISNILWWIVFLCAGMYFSTISISTGFVEVKAKEIEGAYSAKPPTKIIATAKKTTSTSWSKPSKSPVISKLTQPSGRGSNNGTRAKVQSPHQQEPRQQGGGGGDGGDGTDPNLNNNEDLGIIPVPPPQLLNPNNPMQPVQIVNSVWNGTPSQVFHLDPDDILLQPIINQVADQIEYVPGMTPEELAFEVAAAVNNLGYNSGTNTHIPGRLINATQSIGGQGPTLGQVVAEREIVCTELATITHLVLAHYGIESEVTASYHILEGGHVWVVTDNSHGDPMVVDSTWNAVMTEHQYTETFGGVSGIGNESTHYNTQLVVPAVDTGDPDTYDVVIPGVEGSDDLGIIVPSQ